MLDALLKHDPDVLSALKDFGPSRLAKQVLSALDGKLRLARLHGEVSGFELGIRINPLAELLNPALLQKQAASASATDCWPVLTPLLRYLQNATVFAAGKRENIRTLYVPWHSELEAWDNLISLETIPANFAVSSRAGTSDAEKISGQDICFAADCVQFSGHRSLCWDALPSSPRKQNEPTCVPPAIWPGHAPPFVDLFASVASQLADAQKQVKQCCDQVLDVNLSMAAQSNNLALVPMADLDRVHQLKTHRLGQNSEQALLTLRASVNNLRLLINGLAPPSRASAKDHMYEVRAAYMIDNAFAFCPFATVLLDAHMDHEDLFIKLESSEANTVGYLNHASELKVLPLALFVGNVDVGHESSWLDLTRHFLIPVLAYAEELHQTVSAGGSLILPGSVNEWSTLSAAAMLQVFFPCGPALAADGSHSGGCQFEANTHTDLTEQTWLASRPLFARRLLISGGAALPAEQVWREGRKHARRILQQQVLQQPAQSCTVHLLPLKRAGFLDDQHVKRFGQFYFTTMAEWQAIAKQQCTENSGPQAQHQVKPMKVVILVTESQHILANIRSVLQVTGQLMAHYHDVPLELSVRTVLFEDQHSPHAMRLNLIELFGASLVITDSHELVTLAYAVCPPGTRILQMNTAGGHTVHHEELARMPYFGMVSGMKIRYFLGQSTRTFLGKFHGLPKVVNSKGVKMELLFADLDSYAQVLQQALLEMSREFDCSREKTKVPCSTRQPFAFKPFEASL